MLKRKIAYDDLLKYYSFCFKFIKTTAGEIRISAEVLRNEYNIDLRTSFSNECIHFGSYLKTISNPLQSIQELLVFIRINDLKDIFPYVDIALRILLCTPVSNCSTKRSFSALKYIKSYLLTVQHWWRKIICASYYEYRSRCYYNNKLWRYYSRICSRSCMTKIITFFFKFIFCWSILISILLNKFIPIIYKKYSI